MRVTSKCKRNTCGEEKRSKILKPVAETSKSEWEKSLLNSTATLFGQLAIYLSISRPNYFLTGVCIHFSNCVKRAGDAKSKCILYMKASRY